MNHTEPMPLILDRLQQRALIVGTVALAACLVGAVREPEHFYRAWLVGFLFWAGIALGCFALVMLHHMVGGGWGFVIQRPLEAGTRTFPLLLVLFVPLLVGVHHLYEWSHAEAAANELLRHKARYLNVPFFTGRAAGYFLVWIGVAWLLNKWSAEQDRTGDPAIVRRLQMLSGPGLLLYGLTVSFASVDWVMSLEPHWFSTIYGMAFMVGQGLATLAFVVIVARLLAEHKPLAGVIAPSHFHDLGNLMLAFVLLWAYIAFSQFLIIWSGNLPEENVWYLHRMNGGWQYVALILIAFHWAIPFLLLLSRKTKRRAQVLAGVAAAMLFMRLLDLFWAVIPAFEDARGQVRVHWMDILAPVGIGGVWLAFYLWQLKRRPLLPLGDKRMTEAFAHAPQH